MSQSRHTTNWAPVPPPPGCWPRASLGPVTARDLAGAHETIVAAVRKGVAADLGDGSEGGPPPYDDEGAWEGRTVDGAWLAALLAGGDADAHWRSVGLRGARILGGLDLEGAELPFRLDLTACQLGEHPVVLRDARLRTVQLAGVACGGIEADRVKVDGALLLPRTTVAGALRLTDARIDGSIVASGAHVANPGGVSVDCSGADVSGSIDLGHGFVSAGEVRLRGADVGRDVHCEDATITNPGGDALTLDNARIGGGVHLQRLHARGRVRLVNGDVDGDLHCTGARLENPEGIALYASRVKVGGHVLLLGGFTAHGEVRLRAATIKGGLDCRSGVLSNQQVDGDALNLDAARIDGLVTLHDGFRAEGQVRLVGTSIGGMFDCRGAQLDGRGRPALDFSNAQVGSRVRLSHGFRATGVTRFVSATIGGDLDCEDAHMTNPGHFVLHGTGAQVAGSVVLISTFRAEGEVRLIAVSIGGDLYAADDAAITAPGGHALTMPRARVAGNVTLGPRFTATGDVRLPRASVGGSLDCQGAALTQGDSVALDASNVQVAGTVKLVEGTTVDGEFRMVGATVGGNVDCGGLRVRSSSGPAMVATNTRVTGSMYLNQGFAARGEVRLNTTSVGGNLSCRDGSFENPDGPALVVMGAQVAGALVLDAGFHAVGPVVLRAARVGTFLDDAAAWPQELDMDGFEYDRLVCPAQDRTWRARRRWLRRQSTPSAQGYVQLAAVYRASGDDFHARRILIERHNALLRPPDHWRPHLPIGIPRAARTGWRWLLRLTIGHGFVPARSLVIAVPLTVALALWLTHARAADMLVPTADTAVTSGRDATRSSACDDRYPCVQPVVYALDNLVPIVELGQRSRWTPDQSHRGDTWLDDGRLLAAATWTTSVIGWVLATLVAASFTQVIRRE